MQRSQFSTTLTQPLSILTIVSTLLICLPLIIIVSTLFTGSFDAWIHLYNTVLTDYIINSFWLSLGVGIGVFVMGVPAAWITSSYDFPGKRFFTWAMLLPLAIPAYIIAYTYTGLLDYSGPVQTLLRSWFGDGVSNLWFLNIRSLGGAILMLSLVLYPYVYLLARSAFLNQSSSLIEAGRSLGYSYRQTIFKLVIPLARPAIIAGITLALMETLADFGTVEFFGVDTFTTGIFRTFYGLGDTAGAIQLAATLLFFVILLIFLERFSRKKTQYHNTKGRSIKAITLSGAKAWLAILACFLPFCFGFVIPALQLIYWSAFKAEYGHNFAELAWNSFSLALMAAIIATVLATILSYSKRLHAKNAVIRSSINISSLGYAMPGTIIAIGIIVPFAWFDQQLIHWAKNLFDIDIGLIFSGTLIALIFAYTVRFLAVSFGAVDSGLQKIKPSLDDAARSLGKSPKNVLTLIHLPLLYGPVLTAILIVFVDVLKELPATLILRPFDFNTLAIRAYELASDERLIDAAPASLLIVLVGIIPVIILSLSIQKVSH